MLAKNDEVTGKNQAGCNQMFCAAAPDGDGNSET